MLRRAFLASLPLLAACKPGAAQTSAAAPDPTATAAFFAKNAKAPGVKTLPGGLQYKVLHTGPADGPHPQSGDTIKINYEGTLLSGEVFDSTFQKGAPAVLELDGLIPGWVQALPLMRPGDEWVLYVPPELGYGERGAGPIPPNSPLVFRIQLLGVLPSGRNSGLA